MKLEHKNIVITGGTTGIGRELTRRLCASNRVLVIASNRDRLDALQAAHPEILTCRADLSNPADLRVAARSSREAFGQIDLLINNAAVQYTPTFLDPSFDIDTIAAEISVNFTAICSLTALLLPALTRGHEAAIVNVNSGLALMPKTQSAVYCATKAAVNVFSQSLRYQLEDTNVKVLQAFMPLVDTRMTDGRGKGKLSPAEAARAMLRGIARNVEDNDIGQIRQLRRLIRVAPGLARRIMKAA